MSGSKIRIGKDIAIEWAILTNGEALSLEGRDLKLVLTTPLMQKINLEFNLTENIINATYKGVDQKHIGPYTLTLWENYGKDNQSAIDYCNAFFLVAKSCMESEDNVKLAKAILQLSTQQVIGYYLKAVKSTNEVNI